MNATPQRLNALSQAVLQLHRGSREWAAASFDRRAAELLVGVVPFDACLWGSTPADSLIGTPLSLIGLYSQGLEAEALADCLAGGGPAAGLAAHVTEPLAGRRVEVHLWRHARRTGETGGTCETEDTGENGETGERGRTGRRGRTGISGHADFEPDDRASLAFLMPHLVEAQRENRLGRAQAAAANAPPRRSLALCDGQGGLQQADEQGLALLRSEWPRWLGTRLPEPLALAVQAADAAGADPGSDLLPPFYGRSITVLMARSGAALLLDIRRRVDADRLSGRQRDIALLYAAGHSGPQIAARLGLSPSTINNHLGVVFKKLAVKNKLQLLDAMRGDADGMSALNRR